MFRSFLFILATFMLISCGSKAELSFESPDKTNHIDLKGSKSSSLDPWIIELIATKPEVSKTFHVEFFNSSLTNETVKVDWTSESEAAVSLIGQDDVITHLLVIFKEGEIVLIEQ